MAEPTTYTHDVFISYSHADWPWVQNELVPPLQDAGFKVILDRDFVIGRPSLINMELAVERSRHTLAVLTPAYVASAWGEFEGLLVATVDPAGRKRRLLPLMLEPCDVPARIAMLTRADFSDPRSRGEQMTRLIRDLAPDGSPSGVADPPTSRDGEPAPPSASALPVRASGLSVSRGLTALAELLRVPGVRAAVVGYRADFEAACQQIAVVNELKGLHDRFQRLESTFYVVYPGTMRTPPDWDGLERNEPMLQADVDQLLEYAAGVSFAAETTVWRQKVERSRRELRAAIDGRDDGQLRQTIKRLDDVLGSQPSRTNTRLVAAVGALRLPALVRAMAIVCDELARLNLDRAAMDRFRELEASVRELAKLSSDLTILVVNHDSLQVLNDELRRIENLLDQDPTELANAWPDLEAVLQQLADQNPAGTPSRLAELGAEVASALPTGNPERTRRAFRDFRGLASRIFTKADTDLLRLCGELHTVGGPLDLVLGMIQDD